MRKGQIVAALKKRMAQLEAQAKQHKSRMTMRRAFCKVQANKNLLVQGESGAAQHRNMHGTVVGSQAARGSRNVAQDMYRGKLTHSEFAPERAACGGRTAKEFHLRMPPPIVESLMERGLLR